MDEESFVVLSKDGLKLHAYYWAASKPSAVLCIIHGLGEHAGRYRNMASKLGDRGICTFALDVRGHGKSPGRRGHSSSYDLLLNDVEELLKTARAEHTDLPLFLFGHSMGGNLVANYMLRMNTNEIKGFVISSPWLRLAFDPPAWKINLGRIANRFVPILSQSNDLNTSHLSKIEEEVRAYENDELVHDKITPGLFFQIMDAGEYALESDKAINRPGLVYHGSEDKVTSHDATMEFSKKHSSMKWESISNSYHEPHNDVEKEIVFNLLGDWILETTQSKD